MTGAVLLVVGLVAAPARAWTPKTRQEIASDAMKLSPRYLRLILEKHQEDVLRGALGVEKPAYDRAVQNIQDSTVPQTIEKQVGELRDLLKSPKMLSEAAYRFGLISSLVADAANPMDTANDDAREAEYRELFSAYVEKEMKNFRVVFRGFTPDLFSRVTMKDYLNTQADRAKRFYPTLGKEFVKGGKVASISTFSHQSVPFAIASLSYGNAVTLVADVWRNAWKSCGGNCEAQPIGKKKS